MAQLVYEHPLKVPSGYELSLQNARGYDNGFPPTITIAEAVRYLEEEIMQLGPERAILYSNYDKLNNDRLRKKLSNDSAVCLEMHLNHERFHMVCDRWHPVEHNVYALHLALRNLRSIEKWGLGDINRIMLGFSADVGSHEAERDYRAHTAEQSEGLPGWMQVLGLGPTATLDDANAIYRRRAKDHAEDGEAMLELNQAIEEARKHLR